MNQNNRRHDFKPRIYYVLFYLWATILMVLSFYAPSWLPLNPDLPEPDKYKHVIGAFVLALLFCKAYPGFKTGYALLTWILFNTCFEALQQIITRGQREFDWMDVAANILGFTLGAIVSGFYRQLKSRASAGSPMNT